MVHYVMSHEPLLYHTQSIFPSTRMYKKYLKVIIFSYTNVFIKNQIKSILMINENNNNLILRSFRRFP